jgi:hypothetical protein
MSTRDELGEIPESMMKMGNSAAGDLYTMKYKEEGIKIHPARFPAPPRNSSSK